MKKIVVPQDYLDYLNLNMDRAFFEELKTTFLQFGKDIKSINDTTMIMRKSTDKDLNESVYKLLDKVDENKKCFIYDLLILSNFPKKRIAERLIEDIYSTYENQDVVSFSENSVWFFCDNLRELKQKLFFDEYVKILNIDQLGTCRQPIVELISYCKKHEASDILLDHIDDEQINGHILDALIKCNYKNIKEVASNFLNDERDWVKSLAKKVINQ